MARSTIGSDGDMRVDRDKCFRCGACVGTCPLYAIRLYEGGVVFREKKCTRCGTCVLVCPVGAISEEVTL